MVDPEKILWLIQKNSMVDPGKKFMIDLEIIHGRFRRKCMVDPEKNAWSIQKKNHSLCSEKSMVDQKIPWSIHKKSMVDPEENPWSIQKKIHSRSGIFPCSTQKKCIVKPKKFHSRSRKNSLSIKKKLRGWSRKKIHGRSRKKYIVDPKPACNYAIPDSGIPSTFPLTLPGKKHNGLQDLTPTPPPPPLCPHHIPYASVLRIYEGPAVAVLLRALHDIENFSDECIELENMEVVENCSYHVYACQVMIMFGVSYVFKISGLWAHCTLWRIMVLQFQQWHTHMLHIIVNCTIIPDIRRWIDQLNSFVSNKYNWPEHCQSWSWVCTVLDRE